MQKKIEMVHEAIKFIENNLMNRLDLSHVAEAVHYSKYHLHRVFTETVGITIHDYIKRRQLTEAAKLLVYSQKPIVSIAHIAGYDTQQAFTTVFKAMYKMSPRKFRESNAFYPLQLKFSFNDCLALEGHHLLTKHKTVQMAKEDDIPIWMDLVRLVVDGFPYLHEEEYLDVLSTYIHENRAFILKDNHMAIGIMMVNYETGSIDFFGVHPLFKKKGIHESLISKATDELLKNETISITTYREGDKADTGYRKTLKELGFSEGELLMEFGYPTQRFILQRVI